MEERTCDKCGHKFGKHMEAEPGFAKPCCVSGCACLSFSDAEEIAAVQAAQSIGKSAAVHIHS